jgi:carbon monoxide dehydrogenase subunit G
MELTNEFTVDAPIEHAWSVLTDLERIAPCMPGAQLTEVEGDEYRGNVKIKVGPITAQYKGVATFVSKDDAAHTAVLKAEGRDTRGQGNASAMITATLTPAGAGTKVVVGTDLTITGKVAQMGRGVLADVSGKLLDQFVQSLESDVLSGSAPAATPTGNGAGPAVADAPPPAAKPTSSGSADWSWPLRIDSRVA